MKKEKIHSEEERQKPHLSEETRKKIKTGGPHKNKNGYNKKDKKWKREDADAPPVFFKLEIRIRQPADEIRNKFKCSKNKTQNTDSAFWIFVI